MTTNLRIPGEVAVLGLHFKVENAVAANLWDDGGDGCRSRCRPQQLARLEQIGGEPIAQRLRIEPACFLIPSGPPFFKRFDEFRAKFVDPSPRSCVSTSVTDGRLQPRV